MGCGESKHAVATANTTVSKSKRSNSMKATNEEFVKESTNEKVKDFNAEVDAGKEAEKFEVNEKNLENFEVIEKNLENNEGEKETEKDDVVVVDGKVEIKEEKCVEVVEEKNEEGNVGEEKNEEGNVGEEKIEEGKVEEEKAKEEELVKGGEEGGKVDDDDEDVEEGAKLVKHDSHHSDHFFSPKKDHDHETIDSIISSEEKSEGIDGDVKDKGLEGEAKPDAGKEEEGLKPKVNDGKEVVAIVDETKGPAAAGEEKTPQVEEETENAASTKDVKAN